MWKWGHMEKDFIGNNYDQLVKLRLHENNHCMSFLWNSVIYSLGTSVTKKIVEQ